MTVSEAEIRDLSRLFYWFAGAPIVPFDHAETVALAKVSSVNLQNWNARGQVKATIPAGGKAGRRIYTGLDVAEVAIAAEMMTFGIGPKDAFMAAGHLQVLLQDRMEADAPVNPLTGRRRPFLVDPRSYLAVVASDAFSEMYKSQPDRDERIASMNRSFFIRRTDEIGDILSSGRTFMTINIGVRWIALANAALALKGIDIADIGKKPKPGAMVESA